MNYTETLLVEKIKERVRDPIHFVDELGVINKAPFHKVPPPVSLDELELAEKKLGFQLPSLLRALYLQIGNGGFGPGYGLIGLNDMGAKNYHSNLVDGYLEGINFVHPDYPAWPRQFITICNWGDNITSILEWTMPQNPVYRFNGDKYNEGPYENAMKLESLSFQIWFEDWLSGRPLFKLAP
jgi:hypothetical protein